MLEFAGFDAVVCRTLLTQMSGFAASLLRLPTQMTGYLFVSLAVTSSATCCSSSWFDSLGSEGFQDEPSASVALNQLWGSTAALSALGAFSTVFYHGAKRDRSVGRRE